MSNSTYSSTEKVMDGYHSNQEHGNDDILLSDQMYQENKQSMVRILSEGQQLKLDIHHLREEFQSLLSGVQKFDHIKELPALSPPKTQEQSQSQPSQTQSPIVKPVTAKPVDGLITDAVHYHINSATDVSSRGSSDNNACPSQSTSSQVEGLITENATISTQNSAKSSPTSTRQLPVVLDTPTSSRVLLPKTGLRLDRKSHSASKTLRRYSEQFPPRQVFSASKINSKRRHSNAPNKNTSRAAVENVDPTTASPIYQVLTVRDSPSSESSDSVRAIYKNHKKRLMDRRRESGDGAPCEWLPNNKYARLSTGSAAHTPSQSLLSPMRRLPIRDRSAPSPNTQVIDPYKAASHWSRPQSLSTRRFDDNSDRLRPKFFSMKSSSGMKNAIQSPLDPLTQARPSPEGLIGSAERRPVQRCSCRRTDCGVTSPKNAATTTPFGRFTQPEPIQQNRDAIQTGAKQSKKMNRYKKQQFPKTPAAASSRDAMQYPLETIDENGLIHVVMTPEHYNQHMQHMYGGQIAPSLHRQAVATSSLLSRFQPPSHHNHTHARKNTTVALKDISQISHALGNTVHEQPSMQLPQGGIGNGNGDLQHSFDYPLHSTMSYPLHSTMRNAELFPGGVVNGNGDDRADMSSINIASPESPIKQAPKRSAVPLERASKGGNQEEQFHGNGIDTNSLVSTKGVGYKSVNEAEGINMETFSYDEGVLNTTPVNSHKQRASTKSDQIALPTTPADVVSSYYTLSYDSDFQTPSAQNNTSVSDSECDSSFLSIDPDSNTNRRESEELTLVTPTTAAQGPLTTKCNHHHQGTVTCRCHVSTVRRLRPFQENLHGNADDLISNDVHTHAQLQRPPPIGFAESTVFMDSHLRDISPMEVDQSTLNIPSMNKMASISGSSKRNVGVSTSESDSKDAHNESGNSHNSSKSSGHETRGNLDFMSNMCNSIESINDFDNVDAPKATFKSSVTSTKTVIEVKPVPSKSKIRATKSDREIMAQTHVESNCLNLGKILSMKDNKAKYVEKTVVNRTMMANQNVTMVADGCLGFLRKKKTAKQSKSKDATKPPKSSRKLRLRGSKIKPDIENFDDAENKENAPAYRGAPVRRLTDQPSYKTTNSAMISDTYRTYPINHSGNSRCYPTMADDQASVVSSSIHPGCMGTEMKRKLSKRMRDFRKSSFSEESRRSSQQHLGHL